MNTEITYHVATEADIDDIQGLLYPAYFNESHYSNLDYSAENTRIMIEGFVKCFCFIARKDGKVCGIASMYFVNTFYKQREADVDIFFVLPECRGTKVARDFG